MTDSNNNDNNVQKRREIYEFPISLLRLFGINIANLLGRRQFYRGLSKEKSFPGEMTDLIEELMVKSIVEEKEKKSGAGRLDGVITNKAEFDYFFGYEEVSPKTGVWLFYLNTVPVSLNQLAEQLISENIPDFRSLGLPFYSSETIIFLEKSAFRETEISPSIVEKHLDKFLETNKIYKRRLLRADYEFFDYDTESESSDVEENESDVSSISELFGICENWFIEGYISTELKSRILEKFYSGDTDSKRTGKIVRDMLAAKSEEVGWSSKDPIFVVSKDLNALVELGDLTTEKISLKGREGIGFLTERENSDQLLTPFQFLGLLKGRLKEIYCAHKLFRDIREMTITDSNFFEPEEDKGSLQKTRDSINTRLEKYLILIERLEKNEGENGDEKKDGREGKKFEYGYRNGGKFIKLISLKPEPKIVEKLWGENEFKDKELVAYLDLEKVKDFSLFESLKALYDENHSAIEEETRDQEQILYRVQKDS